VDGHQACPGSPIWSMPQRLPRPPTSPPCLLLCRNEAGSAYGDQSGSGAHSAKRQLRMLREIASLATTLPLEWESSVHIRVDQGRMDLIKALIIGPEDTPYR
jgi:hypothetical protein